MVEKHSVTVLIKLYSTLVLFLLISLICYFENEKWLLWQCKFLVLGFFNQFIVVQRGWKETAFCVLQITSKPFKTKSKCKIFFVIIAIALLHLGECVYPKSLLELPERSDIDTSA